jgi:predicted ester cyclase
MDAHAMENGTTTYSAVEQKNIDLVKQYMQIVYDPEGANAAAVAHLCAPNNRFIAPTTFPHVHTLEEYAEDHGCLMKQVIDLHVVSFEIFFAKDDRVCMRYTAQGTHSGEPHQGIVPTGRKSRWTACALFRIENGKLVEFVKEWNKLAMWEQFGWSVEEYFVFGH